MRRNFHLPILIGTCLFSLALGETEDAVAVRVDGRIEITKGEVDTLVQAMAQGARRSGMGTEVNNGELRQRAIDQLVMQSLLLDRADAAGITVDEAEVQAFIEEHLPPGVPLAEMARAQGVTEAKLRSEVTRSMQINRLFEQQFENLADPTEAELQAEFDALAQQPGFLQVPESAEARHILIRVEEDADEATKTAARERLEGLRQRILEGEDFAALAAEHSACPSGARAGGNLGSFGRGQMVPPFDEAVFAQEVGTLGDIVETNFGFHLIEVLSRDEAGERTLESEREPLGERIKSRKQSEVAEAFIEQLREDATVEVLEAPPPEAPAPDAPQELPEWAR